jgi:hypothetical protein
MSLDWANCALSPRLIELSARIAVNSFLNGPIGPAQTLTSVFSALICEV